MSEDFEDKSQKTESPTPHRLEEAQKKGQIPLSKEFGHFCIFIAISIVFIMIFPATFSKIAMSLKTYLEFSHAIPFSEEGLISSLIDTLYQIGFYLLIPYIFLMAAALIAAGIQTKFKPVLSKITPKFENISPHKGFTKIFSQNNLIEFMKSLLKFILMGSIVGIVLYPEISKIDNILYFDIRDMILEIEENNRVLLVSMISILAGLAGLDYAHQKYENYKNLRMSHKEIKDEHKKLEGDPQIKQKLSQLRQEKLRRSIMKTVPKATVIVTNPTHYAVALLYEMGEMEAPVIIAKGVDQIALQIREIAKAHDIPLYQNPPLARELYNTIDVDNPIDPKQYAAVARIIRYVMGHSTRQF